MKVAAEHSETHGKRTGQGMKERFLLDRIQLQCANVSLRDEQLSAAIETHAANAIEPIGDHAAMTARYAPQLSVFQAFI
jgi:hypothetical protein